MRMFRNERGQTAIFIALIFQVLFVLFAMTINVALVVHDKINLQNAVDLAAYYAAQRQAEILNAIAHNNYQIRQAWKLLAWRYRVLGTMGLDRGSYRHPVKSGDKSEAPYAEAVKPVVCVTYSENWAEVPKGENLCNKPNIRIPPLPEVKVIAGFLGINHAIAALSRELRNSFANQCDTHGAYNWWYAMSIMHSFRIEQRNRKMLIYGLANNLSQNVPDSNFSDLNGESVLQGSQRTYEKNLTFSNRNAQVSFEMLNSLRGVKPEVWLPEIQINPTMLYVDVTAQEGCNAENRHISQLPQRAGARERLLSPSFLNSADLVPWSEGEPPPTDPYHMSLGVEKNPWYMAYVGVRASTAPRQIFFPIGPNVTLTARGFAQPFGGRIGPWHGGKWPLSSGRSVGPQIDTLLPARTRADGLLDSPDDPTRLPNYSRFPGDKMGLISKLAQSALNDLRNLVMKFDYLRNIKADYTYAGANDGMAWNYNDNTAPMMRFYEMAAIAPDLFDATYYSVEPNYADNYYNRLLAARGALGLPPDLPIRLDMGVHAPSVPLMSVQMQMSEVQTKSLQIPDAFYFIRKKENLLTGWAPGPGTVNYAFPDGLFGECQVNDDKMKVKTPGSCIARGGRVGYSVKIVNRHALNSPLNKLGGKEEPEGPIQNPPSAFGW